MNQKFYHHAFIFSTKLSIFCSSLTIMYSTTVAIPSPFYNPFDNSFPFYTSPLSFSSSSFFFSLYYSNFFFSAATFTVLGFGFYTISYTSLLSPWLYYIFPYHFFLYSSFIVGGRLSVTFCSGYYFALLSAFFTSGLLAQHHIFYCFYLSLPDFSLMLFLTLSIIGPISSQKTPKTSAILFGSLLVFFIFLSVQPLAYPDSKINQ